MAEWKKTTEELRWERIVNDLFAQQESLMQKYQHIEQLPAPPLSLQAAAHQKIMKDFAWRVTEELVEAQDAYAQSGPGDDAWVEPTAEELADAMHFLIELLIFAAVTPSQCLRHVPEYPLDDDLQLDYVLWRATRHLGDAMRELRNKAWKQKIVQTDELRCRRFLVLAFAAHLDIWRSLGFTEEDLRIAFAAKHAKNHERIKDGY